MHKDHYPELSYYMLDLGPIVGCWLLGLALFVFFVVLPFLFWCTVKCKCRGDDLLCTCETCHCDYCGRLKCSNKEEKCSCKRCTENSTNKSCHSVPGCEKCIMTAPGYEGIGCKEKSTKICTKEHLKSCFCEFCKKIPNFTWKISNLLIRLLFGGSVGPLRESKKMSDTDHHGRDILYISDTPIPQNAVMLHLAITLKSIMLIVFCLSTFFDIFLVKTKYDCEDGFDCYIFDNNFNDYPIENCTIVNVTTICYKLVFDYKKAAGYVGGLYTVSRLVLAFFANSCVYIHKKIRNWKGLRCILILIQYGIGFSFIVICLGVEYGKYNIINGKPVLSQIGDVFSSLGIVLTIALSVLTPWHLAVWTIDKVSPQTQNGALNIQQSESQDLASGEHFELDQANDYDIQRVTEKTRLVM